jgi:hypothetical protein
MRPADAIDDRPQKAMAMAMPADRMSPRLPRLWPVMSTDGEVAAEVVLAGLA